MSLYERVGGDEYFHALAGIFYDGIDGDPVLRTWAPGRANLAELLIQRWGGPHDYSARRGHPRLPMRHFPIAIGGREREAWIHRVSEAVRMSQMSPGDVDELLAYFETASTMLVNRAEQPVSGGQTNDRGENP